MAQVKIVAVANLKGGAGKTTATINVAVAAERAGIRTAIIDIDPEQQASARWSDGRSGDRPRPTVHSAVHTRLAQAAQEAEGKGAALVLIDCPALAPAITAEAVKIADLVLVPCRATVQDVQFLTTTADIAAAHQKPTAVILNAVEPQLKETDEARAFMANAGLAVAPVSLGKAVAFYRAIAAGLGVTEYEPKGKAAQETLQLLLWMSRLLDLATDIHTEPTAA